MKIISDSGPLINLAKVGQFALLQEVFQRIIIPMEVYEEVVVRGEGRPGASETRAATWIVRRRLRRLDVANVLAAELDRGEAAAIALALQEKADYLLIDERAGRRFARQSGLKIKGTLGILIEGVRRELITDLQPILDEMIAEGTWIDSATYEQVIALAQDILRTQEK